MQIHYINRKIKNKYEMIIMAYGTEDTLIVEGKKNHYNLFLSFSPFLLTENNEAYS